MQYAEVTLKVVITLDSYADYVYKWGNVTLGNLL